MTENSSACAHSTHTDHARNDVALKRILTRPGSALLRALTGYPDLRWLNVELPTVTNLRVDLLGQFPFRMAEYLFAIGKRYGRLPRQIVLYIGEKPLRMKNGITSTDLTFRFQLVDARDLDADTLLASDNIGDTVMAILTRLGAEPGTLRRILRRIAAGPPVQRDEALTELTILAGL